MSRRGNKRINAQRDANEPEIVDTLSRQHKVQRLNEEGVPDLLVSGIKECRCSACGERFELVYNSLIEIKVPGEKLNKNQVPWHFDWLASGGQVEVAETIEEALAIVAADHLQGMPSRT